MEYVIVELPKPLSASLFPRCRYHILSTSDWHVSVESEAARSEASCPNFYHPRTLPWVSVQKLPHKGPHLASLVHWEHRGPGACLCTLALSWGVLCSTWAARLYRAYVESCPSVGKGFLGPVNRNPSPPRNNHSRKTWAIFRHPSADLSYLLSASHPSSLACPGKWGKAFSFTDFSQWQLNWLVISENPFGK